MDRDDLATVDRLVAALTPGKQEMVREIVVDAVRRGHLPGGNRRVLDTMSGSPMMGDVLVQALAERARRADATPELTPGAADTDQRAISHD